jgi:hypothetical protein
VSDRDSRFTSAFWKALVKALDIWLKMPSPFHPPTDGQTEWVNHMLECYQRNSCNFKQDNWSERLPMAEYVYNNSLTTATRILPFFANFGFDPRTNWPFEAEVKNPAYRHYVQWITSVHVHCRKSLEQAQVTMGKYHDRCAKEPLKYSVGDLVMLNRKNLKPQRPSRKLEAKLHGPCKISKVLSPTAIVLELPNRWCIHNAFHVSLIQPYRLATNPMRSPPKLASASEQN